MRPCSGNSAPVVVRRSHPVQRALRFTFKWLLICMLSSILLVFSVRFVDPPWWGWQLHRSLFHPPGYPAQTRQQWVTLAQIAKPMQLAVIAAEDQRFPLHTGFDWQAIQSALDHNEKHRQVRGGSTISQQTAKNLFLWPSRSYLRKAIEAWLTLWLEWLVGKERILELYLNVVEFGPGIYGVEAASHFYFNKAAQQLNWVDAARLAAVLPNPYVYRANPPTRYVAERSQWITQQMRQLGLATLSRL